MSIRALLAKERILKLIQAWDEKQIETWRLPELLPQLLNDSKTIEEERIKRKQALNLEIQKKKDMSIEEIMSEKRLIDDEIKDITNELSYKRFRGEKIDDEYERDCEIKIEQLLQDYNGLDTEMRKKERILMEEKSLAISRRIQSICDDDEDDSISLRDIHARYSTYKAILPDLPTKEPDNSLSMGDEHLDTIPSVENLVPIPSESEGLSDNESECDVPVNDESSLTFTTFSNPHFDSNDDFTYSDDESLTNENLCLIEIFRRFFYPKIDSLLEEFSGELAHIDLIPPGINKADFDPEEEIRLIEELLYDNSSPQPLEESNSEISDATIESLSSSPIPVEDIDSFIEEIDLFLASDDSMPPGIKNDDYDSEGDIRFLEELLSNDSPPFPENESPNLDHFNDPSSPRPPSEPPDVEICFDFEPDTAVKNDFDELNDDDCFDPGGGYLNFEDSHAHGFVHSYIRASYPQLHLGNPIS
ncbi:hypothetical protein Tco_0356462 [Tanacetum coccineum]